MADTTAAPVSQFLGWKATDDQSAVLIGFQQPDGGEFALHIPRAVLGETIANMVNATDAFPAPKGMSVRDAVAMETNRFQFGQDDATGDFFLILRLTKGGHLSFVMDRSMAAQLTEALNAQVLGVATGPPPGTSRN